MEASALQVPAALPQTKVARGTPLLRFRSDEQLVALFRAGHEDAFRVIHERYHKRLFAYTRQMLPARQDAEDALQDVFIRAYSGLRASDRQLALRAWLFRVAHNRCIDELRRPAPPPPEVLQLVRGASHDPSVEVDLRESLRRLIEDIRRLPEQQRSALLMRELGGMSYADLAASLGISVGAVKSLLVRARLGLAQATAARDTACGEIREHLVEAHDRGLRPDANARRHMRDCTGCKTFRRELRGVSRQLAAVAPAAGPVGVLAKLLGFSGGGGAGGGAALLGGGGATASAGAVAVGVNHVATLIVAAVATAGGAVEIQHTISASPHHPAHARRVGAPARRWSDQRRPFVPTSSEAAGVQQIASAVEASVATTAPTGLMPSGAATTPKPKAKKRAADRRAHVAPPVNRRDQSTSSTSTTSTLDQSAAGTSGASTTSTSCSTATPSTSSTPSASSAQSSPAPSATTAPSTVVASSCTATATGSSTPATSSTGTTSTSGTGSSGDTTSSGSTSPPPQTTSGGPPSGSGSSSTNG